MQYLMANPPVLRDSLRANLDLIGMELAVEIRQYSRGRVMANGYDPALRARLRDLGDPFAQLRSNDGQTQDPRQWWVANRDRIERVVAAEEMLIENAVGRRRETTAWAVERYGADADPLAIVHATRGREYAWKVERHAAIRASHLPDIPQERLDQLERKTTEAIGRTGIAHGNFETVARSVALAQHRLELHRTQVAQEAAVSGHGQQADDGHGFG